MMTNDDRYDKNDDEEDDDNDHDDNDDNSMYATEDHGGSGLSPALQMSHHSLVHRPIKRGGGKNYNNDDHDSGGNDRNKENIDNHFITQNILGPVLLQVLFRRNSSWQGLG